MNTRERKLGFLALISTFFMWGSIYVAGKMIASQVAPPLLACLRCVIGMVPLLFMARRYLKIRIAREDFKHLAIVGIFGYFLTPNLVQLGIKLTGASMASLINAMTPVAVMVLAAVILKERITFVKVICLILSVTGAAVIINGADARNEFVGIFAVMLSLITWGLASVYIRKLTAKYPPILITTYGTAVSLILHLPIGCAVAWQSMPVINFKLVAVVLYLGFIGSGLSQYAWSKSLSMFPAGMCSLFYPLQAVFSALLGKFILGETLQPMFFWGLLLVGTDVALNSWESIKNFWKSPQTANK